jgi:hypothetical protein
LGEAIYIALSIAIGVTVFIRYRMDTLVERGVLVFLFAFAWPFMVAFAFVGWIFGLAERGHK